MKKIPLFDAHCDTLYACVANNNSLFENDGHFDLKRSADCAPRAQVFSIWDTGEKTQEELFCSFERQINFFHQQCEAYSGEIELCASGSELEKAEKKGKLAAMISVEGGELLGCSPDNLRPAKDLGVSIVHPVWNFDNALSGCAVSGTNKGLTRLGKRFVSEMEKLSMIVDTSHLSEAGFWDVVEILKKPFIAGHSNSKKICDVPRNLTDKQFCALIDCGGVAGINLYGDFVKNEEPKIEDVVKHIEHFLELGGEKSIAFGCDFDGCEHLVDDIEGVQDMYKIYEALIDAGYNETLVNDIFYNNMKRVVSAVCDI